MANAPASFQHYLRHAPEDLSEPQLITGIRRKVNFFIHSEAKKLLQSATHVSVVIPTSNNALLKLRVTNQVRNGWRIAKSQQAHNDDPVMLATMVWQPDVVQYPTSMEWIVHTPVPVNNYERASIVLSDKLRYIYSEAAPVGTDDVNNLPCALLLADGHKWYSLPVTNVQRVADPNDSEETIENEEEVAETNVSEEI